MSRQYISDTVGNTTGIIIPIEEWNEMKKKYPGIEPVEDDIPEWQKDILDSRKKLIHEPGRLIPMEEFLAEMEKEAEEED